jgi:photosystem II stability/assembly factor-like uncharacterized protein
MKLWLVTCLLIASLAANGHKQPEKLTIIDSGRNCSIRGMSIPDNNTIWLSGSNGHAARSTDAGKTWAWTIVAGYEKTDFRDIHAFDSSTAIIMGIGNPAYILKTRDGGQNWKLVYTKDTAGMFLDALDFRNNKEGICIGDPLDAGGGRKTFFLIRSSNGGNTWEQVSSDGLPTAQEGEAVFSASGTNIALLDSKDFDYAFISGGLASNLYLIGRSGHPNKAFPLPINKGKESSGAFSMATDRRSSFYCIGGDYKEPELVKDNLAWTTDNGKTWKAPTLAPPQGYRSCIRIIEGERMIACGSNGIDICTKPNKWTRISSEGFNVCMVSPNKKLVFFAGAKGKIGMLKL